eukprot:m.58976 g.58976  ORF g.58976 m.58976 type:complete len:59 (-) comp7855_c0_seq2:876-1052(-)
MTYRTMQYNKAWYGVVRRARSFVDRHSTTTTDNMEVALSHEAYSTAQDESTWHTYTPP